MLRSIKNRVRDSRLWHGVIAPIRDIRQVEEWVRGGMGPPPPHSIKVRNLTAVADLFGLDVLVETGTYRGQMIDAVRHRFRKIRSIEIYAPFAAAAARKFARDPNVAILHGDSATVLPAVLRELTPSEKALFWLDGHYSGEGTGIGVSETPILAEIENISAHGRRCDAILVDDARCFTGSGGYPTLDSFLALLERRFGEPPLVANDTIFVLPRDTAAPVASRRAG